MRAELVLGAPYRTHAINVISQEVERSGLPVALISEEQFSYESWRSAPYLAQFLTRFDVRILVQLRRQDRWAESMFAQAVRGGYPLDFGAFLGAQATQERLHWDHFLDVWATSFGQENIFASAYQEDARHSIKHLLSQLGLPTFHGQLPDEFNASLSGEAIAFLRGIRQLREGAYPQLNARFGTALASATKGPQYSGFTDHERAAFLLRYTESNRTASLRYLDSAPIDQEPRPQPAPTQPISDARRVEILKQLLRAEQIPCPNDPTLDALEIAFANACMQEEAIA